jgi:hypothetical protein
MVKVLEPGQSAPDSISSILPGIDLGFEDKDGNMIGPQAGLSWVRPVPWGFGKLLDWAYKS